MPVKMSSTAWVLMLLLLMGGKAYALCWSSSVSKRAVLNMEVGSITVPSEAPVGAVVATRTWSLNESGPYYTCRGESHFETWVNENLVRPAPGNGIHRTNIPGIGLRFSIQLPSVSGTVSYPGEFDLHVGNKDIQWGISGGVFKLEVIKIAAITGSGAVAAGDYTTFRQKHGVYIPLTTRFNARSLVIVSSSCKMVGGNQHHVNMRSINLSELPQIGSTAGQHNFALQMECKGGDESSALKVNMTFDGKGPDGVQVNGLLENLNNRSRAAKGIGIQVLDKDEKPLVFRQKREIGRLNQANHLFTIPFYARYYRYAKESQPGPIEALMTFKIDYE